MNASATFLNKPSRRICVKGAQAGGGVAEAGSVAFREEGLSQDGRQVCGRGRARSLVECRDAEGVPKGPAYPR